MSEHRVFLGDFVKERSAPYGRRGRVYGLHHSCPESEGWIAGQVVPVTDDERKERWVSVLTEEGGAIVVPESRLAVVEPFDVRNLSESFYFRPREES